MGYYVNRPSDKFSPVFVFYNRILFFAHKMSIINVHHKMSIIKRQLKHCVMSLHSRTAVNNASFFLPRTPWIHVVKGERDNGALHGFFLIADAQN